MYFFDRLRVDEGHLVNDCIDCENIKEFIWFLGGSAVSKVEVSRLYRH